MPKTHFPRVGGNQWMQSFYSEPGPTFTTGNVFFVHHSGSSTATGRSPEDPISTIDGAFGLCTASQGDRIYVMPGHAETLTAAAGIDADVAGVEVIGLGSGANRPTITLGTANTTDIDIDAASITFRNLIFVANFLDIAAAIDVNADDFTMEDCECRDTSATLNAAIWVLGATATTSDRMIVRRCKFIAFGTANTACVSLPGTPDGCEINDNVMIGDWGTAAILAAGICTRLVILRNLISNLDAGDDKCINIADTSTGICAYNGVGARETDNSTDNITCGTTMTLIQNYSVDEGDRQGVLDPIAT